MIDITIDTKFIGLQNKNDDTKYGFIIEVNGEEKAKCYPMFDSKEMAYASSYTLCAIIGQQLSYEQNPFKDKIDLLKHCENSYMPKGYTRYKQTHTVEE